MLKVGGLDIATLCRYLFLKFYKILTRCLVAQMAMNWIGKGSLMQRTHDIHVAIAS